MEHIRLDRNSAREQPQLRARIANRGNGEAWDVRARVKPDDGNSETLVIGTLKPGETYDEVFFVTKFMPLDPTESGPGGTWADGAVEPKKVRLIVRWRQLPFLRIYRRKTFKVKRSAENIIWTSYSPATSSESRRLHSAADTFVQVDCAKLLNPT